MEYIVCIVGLSLGLYLLHVAKSESIYEKVSAEHGEERAGRFAKISRNCGWFLIVMSGIRAILIFSFGIHFI